MSIESTENFPYSDILDGLVSSVMLAQRAVVMHYKLENSLSRFDHRQINLHFCWLSFATKSGENRHLVEAPDGMNPLGNKWLRNKTSIPLTLRNAFKECKFLDLEVDSNGTKIIPQDIKKYIQEEPTRISTLIINSFHELSDINEFSESHIQTKPIHIRSPLSIIYDFLTVPNAQGTRAYSLLACRNFLFRAFRLIPDLNGLGGSETFSVLEIENSLSHIWTSFRERYLSRGEDKLPPGSPGKIDGLIRHHLALREMLYLRFQSVEKCITYLEGAELVPANIFCNTSENESTNKKRTYIFEFTRSKRLDSLPDAGEIVNELWGLPIPFRGADIIFKGGLKFSGRQGLIMAIHGGPGAGKTSFALALAAHVIPFGISSWFLSAEEYEKDLIDRMNGLIPDQISRLSFFPKDFQNFIKFTKFKLRDGYGARALNEIEEGLEHLEIAMNAINDESEFASKEVFRLPQPCKAIIILDGLHDLFAVGFQKTEIGASQNTTQLERLYQLIEKLKDLHALVILTTGTAWAGDSTLDYLVDVAIRLSHESTDEYGKKPDRRFILTKARHQLCASGVHGLQIGGIKGVRLSPQINYQLEKLSHWRPRLPDKTHIRTGLCRARALKSIGELAKLASATDILESGRSASYIDSTSSVKIYEGSHIFLNGQGSGGKAALAMKLAISPTFKLLSDNKIKIAPTQQRVLVVSFLYPADYYENLIRRLKLQQGNEYRGEKKPFIGQPRLEVIHLYPGHLRPNDLFNRIEWELDAGELNADPYTCVVIDGIHNVFLQFPEIEKYSLFWPQIYSALRSRKITTITTHTTLALPNQNWQQPATLVDDNRSEPLRHALVQKTDFQFEIDSWMNSPFQPEWDKLPGEFSALSDLYVVKAISAIGQKIPRDHLLWSREELELYHLPKEYFDRYSSDQDYQLPLR